MLHIILDSMWHYPSTLFWPLYYITHNKNNSMYNWFTSIFDQQLGSLNNILQNHLEPSLLVSEAIGLAILCFVFIDMLKQHKFLAFLKSGTLYQYKD